MKKIKTILIIVVSTYVGYTALKTYRIGTQNWKYCENDPILGDIATLDFSIKSLFTGKIYIGGQPVARLVDYQYRLIDDTIIIESIDKKRKGTYCSK